jgi:hypothetical protein
MWRRTHEPDLLFLIVCIFTCKLLFFIPILFFHEDYVEALNFDENILVWEFAMRDVVWNFLDFDVIEYNMYGLILIENMDAIPKLYP